MGKVKQPTDPQRHALMRALSKAYWEGWDGKSRSVDASHNAPCIEAGRKRYYTTSSRVHVPGPTAMAMMRQGLVSDYNDSGWLFALTSAGVKAAEEELRKAGQNPKEEAAKRRQEKADAKVKQDEEFQRVIGLFDGISISPAGKKKKVAVSKLIKERAKEGGRCCFDLNELEQIGKQF